jgi:hypothetical protein
VQEIGKHIASFQAGVREKVLMLSLQFRRLVDSLRAASSSDALHLAVALGELSCRI